MFKLDDKILLVTGGGGGIGAATVRMAAALGANIVLHDVKAGGPGDGLAAELGRERCLFVAADLADGSRVPELWQRALAWKGRIDVLVNNAGVYESANVSDDFDDWARAWHRTLEINLVAPAHLCREAIRTFRASGGG